MSEKKKIQCAVAYTLGYMSGKHNLPMSKAQIKKISKELAKAIMDKF